MMPQIASVVTPRAGEWATTLVSAYVIVPQLVVAFLAPWIGHYAQAIGRRPLLLTSFAALALRAFLFAIVENPFALIAVQVLDGLSGAILSVLIALVVADVTRGSGHFNLAVGTIGSSMAIGAALSTTIGGQISTSFGPTASFFALAGIATVGFTLALLQMPETRPRST